MTVLKVDEWQSPSSRWYVADVHTWTGWRECAEVLCGEANLDDFIAFIQTKYHAIVDFYREEKDFLYFYWLKDEYKNAHQFKLDINRIARKKNYLVERSF